MNTEERIFLVFIHGWHVSLVIWGTDAQHWRRIAKSIQTSWVELRCVGIHLHSAVYTFNSADVVPHGLQSSTSSPLYETIWAAGSPPTTGPPSRRGAGFALGCWQGLKNTTLFGAETRIYISMKLVLSPDIILMSMLLSLSFSGNVTVHQLT